MGTARAMRQAMDQDPGDRNQRNLPSGKRIAAAAAIAGGTGAAIYGIRRGGGGGGFMFNQAAEMRRLVEQLSR